MGSTKRIDSPSRDAERGEGGGGGVYRTKRGEKEEEEAVEREIVDWRTDAQHDREARCIAFANPWHG